MSGSMEGKGNGRIHGGEKEWTDPRRGKGMEGSTEGKGNGRIHGGNYMSGSMEGKVGVY